MTDAAPKRVLILDDSAIVLEAVEQALVSAGFQALPAADLAGLERRPLERPDLLIIDVNMPEAFGDDIGAVLRDVGGMSVPILLFSALGEAELAARAKEARFDGFIRKEAGMRARAPQVSGGRARHPAGEARLPPSLDSVRTKLRLSESLTDGAIPL